MKARFARTPTLVLIAVSTLAVDGCSHRATPPSGEGVAAIGEGDTELPGGLPNPVFADDVALGGGRAPASVPHAPGSPPARPQQNPQPLPTPNGPTVPATGGAPSGSQGSCSLPLDKIKIHPRSSYSVLDVLFRRATPQDAMQRGAQVGTFSGNSDIDIQLLMPWFGGALAGPGGDLAEAARGLPAFERALSYLGGAQAPAFAPRPQLDPNARNPARYDPWMRDPAQNQYWVGRDYTTNGKMAGVLFAMFATASDPECTRYIRRAANDILGADVARELDGIWLTEVSTAVANGTHRADFKKLDEGRITMQKQIESVESAIERKERDAERETSVIQTDLYKKYQVLKLKFAKQPKCSRLVKQRETDLSVTFMSETEYVKTLTGECRAEIEIVLKSKLDLQVRYTAELAELQEARSKEPEGDKKPPTSQEKALDEKLKSLQDEVKKLHAGMDWVNGVGEGSILDETQAIEKLVEKRTLINSSDYYLEERRKIAEIRQRMEADAGKWLAFGYTGGYEWQPRATTVDRYRGSALPVRR